MGHFQCDQQKYDPVQSISLRIRWRSDPTQCRTLQTQTTLLANTTGFHLQSRFLIP